MFTKFTSSFEVLGTTGIIDSVINTYNYTVCSIW